MKSNLPKEFKKSSASQKTTPAKKQGDKSSSESMQEKIDKLYIMMDNAKLEMKEMKASISKLNTSVQSLTKAIISNENNNQKNINNLVDSISELIEKISKDYGEFSAVSDNDTVKSRNKSTQKLATNKKRTKR